MAEIAFYLVESLRIHSLCKRKLKLKRIISSRFLSSLMSIFLPGTMSSDVLRVFLVDPEKSQSKIYVALLFLANRVYGLIASAGLLFIALLLNPIPIPGDYGTIGGYLVNFALIAIVFSPLLIQFHMVRRSFSFVVLRTRGRIKKLIKTGVQAMKAFSSTKAWSNSLVSSLLSCLFVVTEFWLVGLEMGLNVSFSAWCVWVPLIGLAAFLPLGVGAFGSQDSAMLLGAAILGLPPEKVIATSLIIHSIRIVGVLPGLIWLGDLVGLMNALKKPKQMAVSQ